MPNLIPFSISEGPKSDCITNEVQDLLLDDAIEQVLTNRYSNTSSFSSLLHVSSSIVNFPRSFDQLISRINTNPNSTTLETGDYSTFQSHVISIHRKKKLIAPVIQFRNFCILNFLNPMQSKIHFKPTLARAIPVISRSKCAVVVLLYQKCNGQAKIMVRIVSNVLRKSLIKSKFISNPFIIHRAKRYSKRLSWLLEKCTIMHQYDTVSETTIFTPFQVYNGSLSRSPISLVMQHEDQKHSRSMGLDKKSYCKFIPHKLSILDVVRHNLTDSIGRSKQQYNENKSPNILMEGDIVYLQEVMTGAHSIRKL
ncbi:hypothetical protein ACTFIW_003338 [Dictyostelium discoideum]